MGSQMLPVLCCQLFFFEEIESVIRCYIARPRSPTW